MSTEKSRTSKIPSRRKFLLAAGATGAATVAMPQVSRAQTVTWKYQSTWPTKDIFHEFAVDYAKKVNDMTGGRLKLDVLAAGAVVPAFQLLGCGALRHSRRRPRRAAITGTASRRPRCSARRPGFGWDAKHALAWFYYGGGEALYKSCHRHPQANVVSASSIPDADAAARLVQEADHQARRFQGPEIPHRRHLDRRVQGDGRGGQHRCRAAKSCRRWTAACSMRPSSTTPSSDILLGFPTSPRSACWAATISSTESFRDHLQQGEVQRASGRAEGDPALRLVRRDGRSVRDGA
jgi:hypothetical protein